jgi:hypothetical protein
MRSLVRVACCALLLGPLVARAQQPPPPPPPATENPPLDLELRLKKLEQASEQAKKANDELREKIDQLMEERQELRSKVDQLAPLSSKISGYLDFGFFWVQSNPATDGNNAGAGIRPDTNYTHFPQYNKIVPDTWTFYGDPLATAINSRGEPASTGDSRAVTFNSINNNGSASFIVNSLTLNIFSPLTDNLTFTGIVDLVPRGRDVSNENGINLGDFLDVRLAFLEYIVPIKAFSLSLFAGKMDSVLGYEYRLSESPDRIGVTPSLICRYTCGHPLGLKARAKFFDDRFIVNLALTNGSSFSEYFPFYDEIDFNNFKTVQGRVSYRFPVGTGLEIGASGAFGAQDNQPTPGHEMDYMGTSPNSIYQWHYGFDLHLDTQRFDLAAEWVQGKADGLNQDLTKGYDPNHPTLNDCALAPCLQYQGAYGQIAYRLFNWLMPYARVDYRNAIHRDGASFVYLSELMRVTVGARAELLPSLILKAEATFIHQLGPAQIAPDASIPGMFLVTSSLVARF